LLIYQAAGDLSFQLHLLSLTLLARKSKSRTTLAPSLPRLGTHSVMTQFISSSLIKQTSPSLWAATLGPNQRLQQFETGRKATWA